METYKGIIHVHSTYSSDGRITLEEISRLSQEKGYKFIFLTEHAEGLDDSKMEKIYKECIRLSSGDFLVIPGLEFSCEGMHILGLGIENFFLEADLNDLITRIHQEGGLAILGHVTYYDKILYEKLSGLDGVEIWNPRYEGAVSPSMRSMRVLRRFRKINKNIVATGGLDLHTKEEFYGLHVCVEADGLSKTGIMNSIKKGRLYTKSGPVRLNGSGKLTLRMKTMIYGARSLYMVTKPAKKNILRAIGRWPENNRDSLAKNIASPENFDLNALKDVPLLQIKDASRTRVYSSPKIDFVIKELKTPEELRQKFLEWDIDLDSDGSKSVHGPIPEEELVKQSRESYRMALKRGSGAVAPFRLEKNVELSLKSGPKMERRIISECIIQEKVEPLENAFLRLVEQGKINEAKRLLERLVEFITVTLPGKGICEEIFNFTIDYGIDGKGNIVLIDIGELTENRASAVKLIGRKEILTGYSFRSLKEMSPELAEHLKMLVDSRFDGRDYVRRWKGGGSFKPHAQILKKFKSLGRKMQL